MPDIDDPIFTDADKARAHLESLRWPKGPVCPHCGEKKRVHRLQGQSHRAGLIQCNACLRNFTVTVGTIFERSKVPLGKWLLAVFLLSSGKKTVSIYQLHQLIGVTYKTAWFMTQRVREGMEQGFFPRDGERRTRRGAATRVGDGDRPRRPLIIRLPVRKRT